MGLDMYLNRHTYANKCDFSIKIYLKSVTFKNVTEIIEEAIYWRKANAIHKWFVDNVQDGEDNCRQYEVSIEQLQELLDTINKILKPKKQEKRLELAQELLPPCAGFFFGENGVDTYYFEELIRTRKELTKLIKNHKNKEVPQWFTYQSSW
jgi:hypothetical protein